MQSQTIGGRKLRQERGKRLRSLALNSTFFSISQHLPMWAMRNWWIWWFWVGIYAEGILNKPVIILKNQNKGNRSRRYSSVCKPNIWKPLLRFTIRENVWRPNGSTIFHNWTTIYNKASHYFTKNQSCKAPEIKFTALNAFELIGKQWNFEWRSRRILRSNLKYRCKRWHSFEFHHSRWKFTWEIPHLPTMSSISLNHVEFFLSEVNLMARSRSGQKIVVRKEYACGRYFTRYLVDASEKYDGSEKGGWG